MIDAMEMMTFNPCEGQINPYGIADWYRYLNLGYRLPVVGGSDKMAAASQLGGVRTYTQLGEREFTYDNWMAAIKAGNTFVTVGPLAQITVEGASPGGIVDLPAGGGSVSVEWRVESVAVPISTVELICGGVIVEESDGAGQLAAAGSTTIRAGRLHLDRAADTRQLPRPGLRPRRAYERCTGAGGRRAAVLRPTTRG